MHCSFLQTKINGFGDILVYIKMSSTGQKMYYFSKIDALTAPRNVAGLLLRGSILEHELGVAFFFAITWPEHLARYISRAANDNSTHICGCYSELKPSLAVLYFGSLLCGLLQPHSAQLVITRPISGQRELGFQHIWIR